MDALLLGVDASQIPVAMLMSKRMVDRVMAGYRS